jgi:hypothetical protein
LAADPVAGTSSLAGADVAPEAAVLETALAEQAPAIEAAGRLSGLARAAAAVAIEALVFVLISLGLSYLEARANRALVRRRMTEAEPRIQSELRSRAAQIAALQQSPARPTVWANITIRLDLSQTIAMSTFGTGGSTMTLLDAGLAGVAVGTRYRADQREEVGEQQNIPNEYGSISVTPIHQFVTYSVPLPYDPYSLDAAGRTQRIAQNEQDAGRSDLPPQVVQALWSERDWLLQAVTALTQ